MIRRIHTVSLMLIFITIILSCSLFSLKSKESEYVRYYEYTPKEKIIIEEIEKISSSKHTQKETVILEDKIENEVTEESVPYDLLEPSGLSVEQLAYGLSYDMKSLAVHFIMAEDNYGINAVHLAAIAALESGWGRYQFQENNIFGFGEMEFESIPQCIDYVASYLKEEYLSEDGMYYAGGSTLSHINIYYNGRDTWYEGVTRVSDQISNKILSSSEVHR